MQRSQEASWTVRALMWAPTKNCLGGLHRHRQTDKGCLEKPQPPNRATKEKPVKKDANSQDDLWNTRKR